MNDGKKHFWIVLIVLALLSACSPTEVAAQSAGNEQRLVGTWTCLHDGSTIVFNANGTVSGWNWYTHWAAAGDRIVAFAPGHLSDREMFELRISSDGRTLILDSRAFRRN